jgi:hypothetical protein
MVLSIPGRSRADAKILAIVERVGCHFGGHERASTFGFAYAVTFSMIVVGQVAVVPLVNVLGQRATFTACGTIFALGGCVAALCWPKTALAPALPEAVADASPVTAR